MSGPGIKMRTLRADSVLLNPGRTLDNTNAHEMVEAITRAQGAGNKFIIVDMRELEFLSSAGVGSILGTIETSREQGGDLIICNASRSILHVLQVLDLLEYLTIVPDEQHAAARAGIEL